MKNNFSPESYGEKHKKPQEIYRELALRLHPDVGGNTLAMQELNAAYETAKKGDDRKLNEMYRLHFDNHVEGHRPLLTEDQLQRKIKAFHNFVQWGIFENVNDDWLWRDMFNLGEIAKERYQQFQREKNRS